MCMCHFRRNNRSNVPFGAAMRDTVIVVRDAEGKSVTQGVGHLFIGDYCTLASFVLCLGHSFFLFLV